jgi:pilus assembly protein Flp/PilA
MPSHEPFKKLGDAVMTNFLARFAKDESGATAIEYGLIAAIIGVGIVAALTQVQTALVGLFGTVSTKLTPASS